MIDPDIEAFVNAVGATVPVAFGDDGQFRRIFIRRNYFSLNGRFLVVKISRSEKPFWGVGKKHIDFLNALDEYFLVLLSSATEGWMFSKSEINANVRGTKWALAQDDNYKINMPLPDRNAFANAKRFLAKMR
jgi:hypothetical protein